MSRFSSIGLIAKTDADGRVSATLRVIHAHLVERAITVRLDESTDGLLDNKETVPRGEIASQCDLAIVVGGDGTLLTAARSLADAGVPIVGVNIGRIGFLVDVTPDTVIERLESILAGDYTEEQRFLLHTDALRGDTLIGTAEALNDVVLRIKNVVRMIEFETWINDRFVNSQRADGMVISTPTGSTAYALAGGGPILHPTLDALLVLPICPHTLSSRPIAITADSVIEIRLREDIDETAQVVSDGQSNVDLVAGDRVRVRRSANRIRLLHPPDYDYFAILREKLHWG